MSTKARAEARRKARKPEAEPIPAVEIPDIVPDDLREDVAWALGFKNFAVDANMFDTGDTPPLMSIYRDGELLLHAFAPRVDRDLGLWFLDRAVSGYSADAASLFTDAHMMDQRFFDEKGRGPDPHELQHMCDNEGACELGLTTDCIFGMHVTRAEPEAARYLSFPYHVNKATKRVHWQPDFMFLDGHDETVKLDGLIANAMREILSANDETTRAFEQLPGDPAYNRFMMDMYLTSQLTMSGFPIMWAHKSDEERELVAEVLASLGASADGREPTQEASPAMRYLAAKTRMMLDTETTRVRNEELAEAARRQAARGETPASWTQPS